MTKDSISRAATRIHDYAIRQLLRPTPRPITRTAIRRIIKEEMERENH